MVNQILWGVLLSRGVLENISTKLREWVDVCPETQTLAARSHPKDMDDHFNTADYNNGIALQAVVSGHVTDHTEKYPFKDADQMDRPNTIYGKGYR